MPSRAGLTIGYNDVHPFCKIELTDRSSVQELMRSILDPLQPFFSPLCARIRVPGATGTRFDQTASEVESFCRPLWGLAFLLAGGGKYDHFDQWVEGLRSGTDPESPEFWGWPTDNDQRMVEMCPLGVGLAIVPKLWEMLSDKERQNVENWLGNSINSKIMPDTNWLWFRVFANLGLKENGAKYSRECLTRDIERLETFYRGDGWANDGPESVHQMDYYSTSFAIQVLQLIYVKLTEGEKSQRVTEYKSRAQAIALDFVYYFDDEGRAIPFGRSTIYKFAMVSFWGALAYADIDLPSPLTWGMVKGIVLRHLRWWQSQTDIWTSSGTLVIGYSYPNMYMAENYNSPGSPYWACLAFICLAVPAEHPFWTSEEAPVGNKFPEVKVLPHPGHIMSRIGGHHMLLSSGQACGYPMKATHAKYGAFAYSSAFGFSVPPGLFTLGQYSLASQLGFSDDGGEFWKARRLCDSAGIEYRDGQPLLVSIWRPFPDVKVKTTLVPPQPATPNWYLRMHRIEAGRAVQTADGAFAILNARRSDGRYLDLYDAQLGEGSLPRILSNYDAPTSEGTASGRNGAFVVSKGAVGIRALEPDCTRTAKVVNADPNSNVLESRTAIPTLRGTIGKGQTVLYVSAIFAKPAGYSHRQVSLLEGWDKPPDYQKWLIE